MPIMSYERSLESGSNLFHYSRFLPELVKSGVFLSQRSNNDGALFFTPVPTLRTNCVATVSTPLRLLKPELVGPDVQSEINDIVIGNWRMTEIDGFDGKWNANKDPYTEVERGIYCDEIIIFAHALRTLTAIRPFDARSETITGDMS
jgi:hypothetical protein